MRMREESTSLEELGPCFPTSDREVPGAVPVAKLRLKTDEWIGGSSLLASA
jgi:hypothetical protein